MRWGPRRTISWRRLGGLAGGCCRWLLSVAAVGDCCRWLLKAGEIGVYLAVRDPARDRQTPLPLRPLLPLRKALLALRPTRPE